MAFFYLTLHITKTHSLSCQIVTWFFNMPFWHALLCLKSIPMAKWLHKTLRKIVSKKKALNCCYTCFCLICFIIPWAPSKLLKKSENGAVVFLSRKIADLDINKLMPISSALFSKIDGNIFWWVLCYGVVQKLRWQVFDYFWSPTPLRWHFLPWQKSTFLFTLVNV